MTLCGAMRKWKIAVPWGKLSGTFQEKLELISLWQRKSPVPLGLVPGFTWDGDITPHTSVRQVRRIRRMAESLGVQLPALGAFIFWPPNPCLTDEDARARVAAAALLQKQVELAWELGTSATSVAIANRKRPDLAPERLDEFAVDSLSRVRVPEGVTLAVEHLLDGFTTSPKRLCRILVSVGNPRIGWQFDPANAIAGKALGEKELRLEPGEAIAQVTEPAHWLATLGCPAMVDVKGIDLANREPWLPPEAMATSARYWPPCLLVPDLLGGSIDWAIVLRDLDKYNYDGWLVYEGLKYDEAAILDLWKLAAIEGV